jgi:hypothetical protein
MTVRRVEPIGFDFSLHLDTLEEADRIDIAAFVDKWLDAFTSEDTEVCRYAQSRVLSPMYRDHDAIGFDAMLEDDLWEQWNDDLEGICPQWLTKPQNRRKLENSTAIEVDMITDAIRATGAVPEWDLPDVLWNALSFQAREVIGMEVSAALMGSPERTEIREALVRLYTNLTQEYRERMDHDIRSYAWESVVLIEQSSNTVCAQGADVPSAIDNLSAFIWPRYILEPTSRSTTGDGVYHAFRVPECMAFDPGDAHLVERWGVYIQSFINVASDAA